MAKTRRSLIRRVLRWLGILVVLCLVASIAMVAALRFIDPPTSAFMMERRVEALRADTAGFTLKHSWVPWQRISPALALAVVAGEDQKFPRHRGFDVGAIQDALEKASGGARLRGASTLSQQTAKNLFLWNGRSYLRKGAEAWFTVLIEVLWPKQRILEVYLNIAEFGDGIYGAEAASQSFFGVSAADLSARQASLLAAVLPNPRRFHAARPSNYVERRAAWIRQQMQQLGGPAYVMRLGDAEAAKRR